MDLNGSPMRVAILLLCLCLAACTGPRFSGDEPEAAAAPPPSAPPPAAAVASPPPNRSAGTGVGPRGGATTAAARAPADPAEASADPVTQARADCWMKVERQKSVRGLDQRIAFVDKCVADQLKP